MLKLYIDNQLADIDSATEVSVSLSVASLTSPWLGRAGYSKSIVIPATHHNRRLMGDCEQPLAATMFNHSLHTARVEARGSIIIEGTIYLTASALGRGGYYRFNIVGNAREWIGGAATPLRELFPEWSATLNDTTLTTLNGSSAEELVRFFPVARGRDRGREGYTHRLLPNDYHPFLNIRQMVERVMALRGYTVESEFMASELFRSLYMSGRLSESGPAEGELEELNFLATRRERSAVVVSDSDGRVYADPLVVAHSIGELVDLPDGEEGSIASSALTLDEGGRLCFTPPTPMAVAFEYHLRYVTGYYLQDRHNLRAHTLIHTEFGDTFEVAMPNTNVDRRPQGIAPERIYTLAIFDYPEEATTFKLWGRSMENGVVVDSQEQLLYSTSARVSQFATEIEGSIGALRLEFELQGEVFSYVGDWAIYDGNVAERGESLVDVCFCSIPCRYSPTSPKYFDMTYFGGAEAGATFRLLEDSSVRPIFYPHPVCGDTLTWADVADYSVTGLDLMEALRELFDLQIYTDPLERKVCIEPRRDYCDRDVVVDLSERVDSSREIVVEELGGDSKASLVVCYRSGDKAVEEYKSDIGGEYGSWRAVIENRFADPGCEMVCNTLFAPTLSTRGVVASAPSMSLLRVGDVDSEGGTLVDRCNFIPKIVSFRGVVTLPEGEEAPLQSGGVGSYPLATFFDDGTIGGTPRSLLIEDYKGVVGLRSYWNHRVDMLNHSRRLRLFVHLHPDEIEQIVVPNSTKRDFRAHYTLTIGGESVLCRMEEIVDYNPLRPSTNVVMVTVG